MGCMGVVVSVNLCIAVLLLGDIGMLWGAILAGQGLRGCLGEAASDGTGLECAYK